MTGQNSYQWNAEEYARHSASQFAWAQELIAKLGLRERERVLDIGCGDGKVTALIAGRTPFGRALGIDNSPGMIELAQSAFPPERHPNLAFCLLDARRLDCDAAFDVAFSNAVLHWVADHRAVLAGVRRALAPGGRLLFQMGGQGNAAEIIATIDEVNAHPAWRSYFDGFGFPYAFYGPGEYTRWLPEAGLTPVRVELIPKDMVHDGPDGLAGWLRTTWLPFIERVPVERRDAWIAEVVDAYLARHPMDATGRVHVAMVRLEVEAGVP
jgi:trans-aconitate 2-methyltransferase